MGCVGSKSLPRHADDRELDELDIQETGVADIDETFATAFAPLESLITINNSMVEAADNVKLAGAAVLGAYTLKYQLGTMNGANEVNTYIVDKDAKELSKADTDKLAKEHVELGKQLVTLEKMRVTANKVFAEVNGGDKKPSTVEVVKGVKIISKDSNGKRFKHSKLNAAVDNFNKQAFFVIEELQKASFADGFNLTKALTGILAGLKKELGDNFKPSLDINTEALMEGKVEVSFSLSETDPVDVLPEPHKTAYKSLMAVVEAVKAGVAEMGELKPKIEEVPETIQNFDAMTAVKNAGLPPMQLPGAMKKCGSNALIAGQLPVIVQHVPQTALAVLGDLKAAVQGE